MRTKLPIFILTILSLVACVEEHSVNIDHSTPLKLSISQLVSNDITHPLTWSEGDKVLMFNQTNSGASYILDNYYVGESSGNFEYIEPINSNVDQHRLNNIIAYSPFDTKININEVESEKSTYELCDVVLPYKQNYSKDEMPITSLPMIGIGASGADEIKMEHICGVINLELLGDCSVKKIVLTGNEGEKITGKANVIVSDDKKSPSVEMHSDAKTSINLICEENPVALNNSTPTSFLISIPPIEFKSGFSVIITDSNNNEYQLVTTQFQEVKRSEVLTMPRTSIYDRIFQNCNVFVSELGTTYAEISIESQNNIELAYILSNSELSFNSPMDLFKDAEVVKSEVQTNLRVSKLAPGCQYHLYFVIKENDNLFSEVRHLSFYTEQSNELITLIETQYDGFKMHITVPEMTKQSKNVIRWNHCCLMMYNYLRKCNGSDDSDHSSLLYNAGMVTNKDTTILCSSPMYPENDNNYHSNPIAPGEPIVLMAGEFNPDGRVSYSKKRRYEMNSDIIDDIDLSSPEDNTWDGAFQRIIFKASEPEPLNGKVDLKLRSSSPSNLSFSFEPDSNVEQYIVGIFDEKTYKEILELLNGKEDFLQWAITSYFAQYMYGTKIFKGAVEADLNEWYYEDAIKEDSNYHVLITSMGNLSGTCQNFQKFTFHTTKKTLSSPEVVVSAVEELTTPFNATFNIKCTSYRENPIAEAYYAAYPVYDWMNYGSTYFKIVKGNKMFSSDELAKINSEDGYTISFCSIDGETTRLAVLGYNAEHTPNDLESYENLNILNCTAVADVTTPWCEAKDIVDPSHYENLRGVWTAIATLQGWTGTYQYSSKITIGDNVPEYPKTLSDDVYQLYYERLGMSRSEVNEMWDEFKQLGENITLNRLKNQNRLLCTGWIDDDSYDRLTARTPYDLFVAKGYKTADVFSIYNDFGPKWYIEAVEDPITGKISLIAPVDANHLPPACNWSITFYMTALETTNYVGYTYPQVESELFFPVEYNAEMDQITIKPYVYNGVEYFPNIVGYDNWSGDRILESPVVSEVVLTRTRE